MEDQLITIWLPLTIAVAFAVIGLLRGAVREAVMAASVVLAAFINLQWGGSWGEGLHDVFGNMSQGQQQFAVTTVVLWLVVLGLGYGLGGVLPKGGPVRASRIGGALLGLASGAAVAGFMLLYAYQYLDGAETTSRYYQSVVSRAFMIWSEWYPLFLAFVGAVLVFIGPMRRAQRALGQPSAASNWSPTTPPQTPAPTMASSMFMPAAAGATAGAPGTASANAPTAPYAVQPPGTVALRGAETPPTNRMPNEPVRPYAPAKVNEELWATRALASTQAPQQPASAASTSEQGTSTSDSYGTFGQSSSSASSWLFPQTKEDGSRDATQGAVPSEHESSPGEKPEAMKATTSFGTEHAIPSRPVGSSQGEADEQQPTSEKKCSNCGSTVAPGASFCTECGTRIT